MLQEFAGVFWVDTSISFFYHNLTMWYNIIKETQGYMFLCWTGHSIFAATHPDMMPYFGITKEQAKTMLMIQGSFQLVFRTEVAYYNYILWLMLCALDVNCIVPEGASHQCTFDEIGNCHRYDQSAASILLFEYLGPNRSEFCVPDGAVKILRRQRAKFAVPTCIK